MKSPETPPLIEMAQAPRKTPTTRGAQSPESSTETPAFTLYKERFTILTTHIQSQLEEYNTKLTDGSFDDQDGEPQGSGDKRKEDMQNIISKAVDRAETMKSVLDSGKIPESTPLIQLDYIYTNPKTNKVEHQESITLDLEQKLEEYISFYQLRNITLPPSFEDDIRDIWSRNNTEIQESIEQNGFNDIIIAPANIPLPELVDKMKMDKGFYTGSNFDSGGGFAGAVSTGVDKPRIILYHKTETLQEIQKNTGIDPKLSITAGDAYKLYQTNPTHYLSTLEDAIILENKYNTETNKHISSYKTNSGQWLPATKSGTRFVYSSWGPDDRGLGVYASGPDYSDSGLGCRPARYFV